MYLIVMRLNLLPDITICKTDEEIRGGKRQKLLFLTMNTDGFEKRKVMVICRTKTPVCFRQAKINPQNLPVVYHKTGCEARFVTEPPKSYTGPPPPVLTHFKLVYLSKDTAPYLQPLDQDIIRSFKAS